MKNSFRVNFSYYYIIPPMIQRGDVPAITYIYHKFFPCNSTHTDSGKDLCQQCYTLASYLGPFPSFSMYTHWIHETGNKYHSVLRKPSLKK